ncbi:bacterio-opsin activator domain-containing protein [Salinirubellus sp. GCM10025818]|uniref:bacterio-opsin activator domain-containing protein n=1 Tax=Salinirubellus TaxID=2162630 RepID=UPI0030D4C851
MSITRTGEDTFFHDILESLETGLVVVDGSGTIVFSNDAAAELVGRSAARLSGRPLDDLFVDEDGGVMRKVREAARSDAGPLNEASTARLVDADGSRLPVRIEVGTTDHDGQQHYTLSLTAPLRQTGPQPLDRTEDVLRGVFEESNDGLLVIDPTADRVLDCNGRACELFGCEREDLLTQQPGDLLPHDLESLLEFAETGRRVTGELDCCTDRDGRPTVEITLSLFSVGEHRHVLVHLRDVTEHQEREARLRRRSEAMDAAPNGIAILDEDREFVYVNRAHAEVYGHDSGSDLVGESWETLYGAEEARRFRWDVLPTVHEEGAWRGEATGRRTDGSTFPQEVSISRLDDGGHVCVVRDVSESRRRTRGLDLLNRASRDLSQARTAEAVAGTAVETAADLLGTDVACVRLFDRDSNSFEPVAMTDGASELVESRPAFDLKSTLAGRAYRAGEPVLDRPDPDDPFVETPDWGSIHLPLGEYGTLTLLTGAGETLSTADRRLAETLAETVTADLERVERERELRESERAVREQRDRLTSLNRVNELVQDLIGELIEAPTREELEQGICERLADTDRYQGAWLAETDVSGDWRVLKASAGLPEGYRTLVEQLPLEQVDDGVVARAAETGEFSVACDYWTDGTPGGGDKEPTRVESTAAVPLSYGDRLYGVLVLKTDESDAFGPEIRSGLEVLGDTIGFAIHAVENRRLLLSDEVVELEFEVTDERCLAVDVSKELDCYAAIEQALLTREGNHLCYLRVDGVDPETAVAVTAEATAVADCRVVDEYEDGCLLEVRKTESGAEVMMDVGATITTATAKDGVGTLVVEAPPDADIREVIDGYTARNPESSLVAKREVDRGARTTSSVRERLQEQLTEKQESALTAAYYAGYYDWPRGSTAEELAESLDVASATLHQHLRAAERKLLAAVLKD